jgi:hypothetical protein
MLDWLYRDRFRAKASRAFGLSEQASCGPSPGAAHHSRTAVRPFRCRTSTHALGNRKKVDPTRSIAFSVTRLTMPHSIQVPSEIVGKWQEIVDLLAEIVHVPSALIMRVEHPNLKVFVASESKRILTKRMKSRLSIRGSIARP